MNILIFDTIFPKGHKDLNNGIVRILSDSHKLIVLNKGGYYEVKSNNIEYIEANIKEFKGTGMVGNQLHHIRNILYSYKKIYTRHSDRIIFTTFDISSFLICLILFPFTPKYLFYHNNTDQLYRFFKKFCFKLYKNCVYHLAFAHCITDYLISLGAPPSRVAVIPHPIPLIHQSKNETNKKYICSLSGSNDITWVDKIINYEKKTGILKTNNIELLIKSKTTNKTDSVVVINNYLSDDDYQSIFLGSIAVLVLLPTDYKYRYSGVIKDALTFNKIVLANDSIIAKEFSSLYPNNVRIYKDVSELFNLMVNMSIPSDSEYKKFLAYHSDTNIKDQLEKILL